MRGCDEPKVPCVVWTKEMDFFPLVKLNAVAVLHLGWLYSLLNIWLSFLPTAELLIPKSET